MTFGEKLKQARLRKGYTQEEVARLIGVAKSTFTGYEKDNREPDVLKIRKIINALDVSAEYLLGTKKPIMPVLDNREQGVVTKYRVCDDGGKEMVDRVLDYEYHRSTKKIPTAAPPKLNTQRVLIHTDVAAAGYGNYLDSPNQEYREYPFDAVPYNTNCGVCIKGDSMEPEIPDGCIAFVEYMPAINPGDIGIFSLDGSSFCKVLVVDTDKQQIRLESINPKYAPIIVTDDQSLHTFGKVVGTYCEE